MTPKEKAYELCYKFMIHNSYQSIVWWNARICAELAVNEIINIKLLWFQKDTKELDYWNEVKNEIQILCYQNQ